MTVCAHRHDGPGFFTSCHTACGGPCACGVEVAEGAAAEGEGER